MMTATLLLLGAYLLGSISSAILVCRVMGLPDPRTEGSKNPGATNVLRIGGKFPATLTLLGDVLKGVLPVIAARLLEQDALVVAGCMLLAFLGHLYPVFFGFQGGKGVATALGVLLAVNPWLGLAAVGTWIVVAFATRISSLSALVAAALAPVYAWWLAPREVVVAGAVMSAVLIWRHRGNIQRIVAGTEGRIGQKKKDAAPPVV